MQLLVARLAMVGMVVIFVGGLYLVPKEVRALPRDDPRHIRARFGAVSAATLLSVAVLSLLLRDETAAPENMLEWVGLPPRGLLAATFLPLMLTASLFLGPLATTAMYLHRWRSAAPSRAAGSVWQWTKRTVPVSWTSALQADLRARVGGTPEEQLRTLVVGPLCEEVVFRGCMLPLLVVAGHRPLLACLECPLVFGTPALLKGVV
jgi:prenyl protein peptidase